MLDHRLLAFEAVLQEGSFERAARRLALTQSAVSQRVKLPSCSTASKASRRWSIIRDFTENLIKSILLKKRPGRAYPAGSLARWNALAV